jgi:hypothetical protein
MAVCNSPITPLEDEQADKECTSIDALTRPDSNQSMLTSFSPDY